jgi:hypothetical protein
MYSPAVNWKTSLSTYTVISPDKMQNSSSSREWTCGGGSVPRLILMTLTSNSRSLSEAPAIRIPLYHFEFANAGDLL